jgi:hypothetical protein
MIALYFFFVQIRMKLGPVLSTYALLLSWYQSIMTSANITTNCLFS